ncbi:FAD-dependent monooxygenase [Psychroserpens damuponensis]|uniref:FAD-dependent monooxygenase n=1 Tax=Psychroserpens damuponensis TaxID=943936 RepID=UPI00058D8C1D|nr:FAD-dependent monooxygenase [Psychroserpens damuponensis]
MDKSKKITIIGAGIAGLTTAIALKQKGFQVEIYESTEKFKDVGSGINLAINAMQIFKRLGIYEDIRTNGHHTKSMNIRSQKLGYLAKASLLDFEADYNVQAVAIHRATLHKILLKHIGDTKIHLNKKLKSIIKDKDSTVLAFEDDTVRFTDIVIGADGIHSAVRKSIFRDTSLRDAKQICWRGISTIKIDSQFNNELNEIWGQGTRFGFVHINDQQVYWFGLMDKNMFYKNKPNVSSVFANYHPTVQSIIQHTPEEKIIQGEIWDLQPLEKWYKDTVCLVGDACHATTPNLGQGAVQAIESAYVLSNCLSKEQSLETTFETYQSIRIKKARHVIDTSWRIGKLAQSNNKIVCLIRDFLVKLTPSKVMKKQNAKVFELDY